MKGDAMRGLLKSPRVNEPCGNAVANSHESVTASVARPHPVHCYLFCIACQSCQVGHQDLDYYKSLKRL